MFHECIYLSIQNDIIWYNFNGETKILLVIFIHPHYFTCLTVDIRSLRSRRIFSCFSRSRCSVRRFSFSARASSNDVKKVSNVENSSWLMMCLRHKKIWIFFSRCLICYFFRLKQMYISQIKDIFQGNYPPCSIARRENEKIKLKSHRIK